jgi:hypothetical protein
MGRLYEIHRFKLVLRHLVILWEDIDSKINTFYKSTFRFCLSTLARSGVLCQMVSCMKLAALFNLPRRTVPKCLISSIKSDYYVRMNFFRAGEQSLTGGAVE